MMCTISFSHVTRSNTVVFTWLLSGKLTVRVKLAHSWFMIYLFAIRKRWCVLFIHGYVRKHWRFETWLSQVSGVMWRVGFFPHPQMGKWRCDTSWLENAWVKNLRISFFSYFATQKKPEKPRFCWLISSLQWASFRWICSCPTQNGPVATPECRDELVRLVVRLVIGGAVPTWWFIPLR